MLLTFTARDLVLASWLLPVETVDRVLPKGLEPAVVAGEETLVSIAAFRSTDVRVGRRRVPGFSQLTVRAAVLREGEQAVYLLALRVTTLGLGGMLYGLPVRPASIRVGPGYAVAKGLGVALFYRPGDTGGPELEAWPPGPTEIAYFLAAGLRRVVAEHEPFRWAEAVLTTAPRLDPLLALGFDVREPQSVLFAEATRHQVVLPPEAVT